MNVAAGVVLLALATAVAGQSCGGDLKGPNGTITSPNWPAEYPNNANCQWTIKVDGSNTIEIEFVDFELERASPIYGCAGRDFVTVVDGSTINGPYCGTTPPPKITSTNNEVTVTFTSDESLTYRGFLAVYREIVNTPPTTTTPAPTTREPPTTNCGGTYQGDEGSLTSPNYPDKYNNSADCSYFVSLTSAGKIKLNFVDIEIESGDNCQFDSLTVHDGKNGYAPIKAKLCGTSADPIVASAGEVYLRFKTDVKNNFKGFNITWEKASCAEAGGTCAETCENGELEGSPCNGTVKCCKPKPTEPELECGKRFIGDENLPYIVGGREAKPNSWPWQASLQRGTFHYCGAVLLSDTWVVTAAHCVHDEISVDVVLGEHDRTIPSGDEIRITASDIIVHEDFINSSPWPNDIALLKLSEKVKLGPKYYPACFPNATDLEFGPDDNCYITGWGDTKGTGDRNLLNELKITALPNEVCRLSWGSSILDTNICVGDGTAGSCQGDSGGPLVCKKGDKWTLGGVTSWGIRGCRTAGYPSVYTRVSKFLPWVMDKIKANP